MFKPRAWLLDHPFEFFGGMNWNLPIFEVASPQLKSHCVSEVLMIAVFTFAVIETPLLPVYPGRIEKSSVRELFGVERGQVRVQKQRQA